MLFRSLIILGFCAAMALNSSAIAGAPPAKALLVPPTAGEAAVVKVAAPKADANAVKKKKLLADAKAKEKAKLAAKAKAAEEKKLATAAAKAKATEQAKLAAKAKVEKERQLAAKKKAEEAKKLAKAKADQERKIAKANAAEERKFAKAKATEERRLAAEAKAKAAEELKLAKSRAAEERRLAIAKAAEDARQAELAQLASMEIALTGNNGELRSEKQEQKPVGLFAGLFGGTVKQSMLPETRALDAALETKQGKKKFKVKSEFEPQEVSFSGYARGTLVIDTSARFLYLVESSSTARRYAIAVGREGLEFKGTAKIGDKQEWPRWIPTKEMQEREPKKYGQYKEGMPGGPDNPLGARAMYLYQGKTDTHIRIHGTNQPQTIGTNSSNGCFRMVNEHVMDLYRRVTTGTDVVVM